MVPEKSTFFCNTMATLLRKTSSSYFRTSTPPTFTAPWLTSYRRGMSCTKVDLALPVPPKTPTIAPDGTCRSTWLNASLSAVAE